MKKKLLVLLMLCLGSVFYAQTFYPEVVSLTYFPPRNTARISDKWIRIDSDTGNFENDAKIFEKLVKSKKYSKTKYDFKIYKVLNEEYMCKSESEVRISLGTKDKDISDVDAYCAEIAELFSNVIKRDVSVSIQFPNVYVSFDTKDADFRYISSAQEVIEEGSQVTLKWIQPIGSLFFSVQYKLPESAEKDISEYVTKEIGKKKIK